MKKKKKIIIIISVFIFIFIFIILGIFLLKDIYSNANAECCSCCGTEQELCIDLCCPCN